MRSRHIMGVVLTVVLVAQAAVDADEQQPEASGAPGFADEIEVEVVTLDVMVTDRRGRPITGLSADAFQVFEDGEKVELTNFVEVFDGRRAAEGEQDPADSREDTGAVAMPKAATEAADSTAATEPVSVVVYVDLQFLRTRGLQRAMKELERFFEEHWRPENQAMLAVSSGVLHVPVPFTHEPEELIAGLEGLNRVVGHMDVIDEERFQGGGGSPSGGRGLSTADADAREAFQQLSEFLRMVTAEEQRTRAVRSLRSLGAMIDQLAHGPTGRRMLLLVSDGMPQLWTRHQLDQLIDHANANRVSVYALLGGGDSAATSSVLSAERHGGYSGTLAGGRGKRGEAFGDSRRAERTVELLAGKTGGSVLAKVNERTLAELARDLNSYYSIGYRPPTPGDAKVHSIKVKVDHKKAHIRHRLEYRSFTQEDKLTGTAIAALMVAQPDNSVGFSWSVGASAAPTEDGRAFAVSVSIEVPLDGVVLLPQGGQIAGSVRLLLAGRHSTDELTPLRGVRLQISQPQVRSGAGETVVHDDEIVLPPGRATIAITVYDEIARTTSSITRWVTIAKDGTVEERSSPFGDEGHIEL